MERVVIALVLIALAAAVALVLERRRSAPPTQASATREYQVPTQLDRADFDGAARPWLVAVFTSSTCDSCAKVVPKARVLECDDVAVVEVPYQSRKDLHKRYEIDVVPLLVVADAEGVVKASFIGNASATDLWASVAEAREPGSSPEPGLGSLS